MLYSLTQRQWLEWVTYLEKYGLPETNADGRVLDQLVVQANMQREKGKRPAELSYFVGAKFGVEEKTPAERMAQLKTQMLAVANG